MPRTYHLAAPIKGSLFCLRRQVCAWCNEQPRHTALAKLHRGLEADGDRYALLASHSRGR